MRKKAIIIGAGPAGLTAAYELLKRTEILPVVLEKSGEIGGISRTLNYKGNRMDMGPHRFFSKSDRVMNWWLNIMPMVDGNEKEEGKKGRGGKEEKIVVSYQNKTREIGGGKASSAEGSKVMLVIDRLTRIYFLRKFFAYPIQLSIDTLITLGVVRTIKILVSYVWSQVFPTRPEKSLEDFIVNKFGRQLYLLFFKDYTEKVWGIAPSKISAEWGAQRIKGVSLGKVISSAIGSLRKKKNANIPQKGTETSLIERFLYPKYGPGSLWEDVARQVEEMGGKIYLHQNVEKICMESDRVCSVNTVNSQTGQYGAWDGDYFFSTMPVQELIAGMGSEVPADVREVAAGLQYRDFINVGILLKQMATKEGKRLDLKDNWIYIQERDVKVGRLMIYNNWGGGMVKDPETTWIGMEYFCNKTDDLWAQSDDSLEKMAIRELVRMDLARCEDVLDITIQRMEKTYPAYFGSYDRFDLIRTYTDRLANLFLIGRNGMHKYNNADHSMLCGMVAVDNIIAGETGKSNLWSINTEQEYHEDKSTRPATAGKMGARVGSKEDIRVRPKPALYREFEQLVWQDRWKRGYFLTAVVGVIVQFLVFKQLYPFANYFMDSYAYLDAAFRNVDVNIWPVAYSKFLRLLSVFTHSDFVLVGFQYAFLQAGGLYLFFTFLRFVQLYREVQILLFLFFVFNPISLYVSNYVSADAIFIGLSLFWFTELIRLVLDPKPYQLVVVPVLLLATFTVRYNAIYYPVITVLAILLSRQRAWRKLAAVAACAGLMLFSVEYTSKRMYSVTGHRQFSAFGGWQLANNALYMYQNIPDSEVQRVPEQFRSLEAMVRMHMDTLARVHFTREDSIRSYFYLWSTRGPLVQFMNLVWKMDSVTPYFPKWAAEGPLYKSYALWLIGHYPVAFARSYLLPNAVRYAIPPLEFLGVYNMGSDSVRAVAKEWFGYASPKVKHYYKSHDVTSLDWYPVFGALTNAFFGLSLIGFLAFNYKIKAHRAFGRILLLVGIFWGLNLGFSVFASPIVLRYQLFPIALYFVFSLIAIQYVMVASPEKISINA